MRNRLRHSSGRNLHSLCGCAMDLQEEVIQWSKVRSYPRGGSACGEFDFGGAKERHNL